MFQQRKVAAYRKRTFENGRIDFFYGKSFFLMFGKLILKARQKRFVENQKNGARYGTVEPIKTMNKRRKRFGVSV